MNSLCLSKQPENVDRVNIYCTSDVINDGFFVYSEIPGLANLDHFFCHVCYQSVLNLPVIVDYMEVLASCLCLLYNELSSQLAVLWVCLGKNSVKYLILFRMVCFVIFTLYLSNQSIM